jgi:hypothetical protein
LFFFSFLLLFLRWRFSPRREDFVKYDQSRIVCFCREISGVEFLVLTLCAKNEQATLPVRLRATRYCVAHDGSESLDAPWRKSWRKSAAVKGNSFECQAFLDRRPRLPW